MADVARTLDAGTVIADRYRVERSLGRGGMGEVYLVFDEIVGEKVALKLLSSGDAAAVDCFKLELRLARRVTHKNIGRTFDLGRDGPTLFITMEAVAGESLRGLMIRRGSVGAQAVGALLTQAAAGLAAAHEAGIVHRDLKPSNILLEPGGRVVVIDFGIAAPRREQPGGQGMISGTYDYMSPEQVRAAPAEPSDDVYALALVAFELSTLQRPFEGPDAKARALARLHAEPDLSPLEDRPELRALVSSCLDLDARKRPTAEELADRFRDLAGEAQTVTIDPSSALTKDELATVASTPASVTIASVIVGTFEVDGHDESFGLGMALSEEVSDALAQSKGLRVVSPHAAPGAAAADFGSLRAKLGVDYVVLGRIQRSPTGAPTVISRLVATATGEQAWTGKFTTGARGWAGLGVEVAVRIAEALRMQLELLSSGPTISPKAAMAFLEGRRLARSPNASPVQAVEALDRCLAENPDFPLAIAARAVAAVKSYLSPDDSVREWSEEARASIRHALAVAPHAPDTHYAAAMLHLADAEFVDALRCLRRVIEIAPTHALAQEGYGRIECEGGRAELGMARLAMALEIDPLRRSALCMVARAHALRGRADDFDTTIERIRSLDDGQPTTEECMLLARMAIWFKNQERARRALAYLPVAPGHRSGSMRAATCLAGLVLGEDCYWQLHELQQKTLAKPLPRRFKATVRQVEAEYETALGDPLRGLKAVEEADRLGLIDVEWIERCPALDFLRDEHRFIEAQARVRARAAALWADGLPSPHLPADAS